jgi:hypothetical protein
MLGIVLSLDVAYLSENGMMPPESVSERLSNA